MAYGGMPFPETGCPVPDVYIYHAPDMINVWVLFLHLSTSFGYFRLRTFVFFLIMDRIIPNGSSLYQIYLLNLIYSAGAFQALQLVLLVAFGAMDEPLASCMMVHCRVFVIQK